MAGAFLTRGHEAARAFVARCIERGATPHALLLVGPPRIGKRTLAEDLAAGLLCLAEDPSERPCRRCLACRKVARGSHPDLHRLAPEGSGAQIRIGSVRELTHDLAFHPVEGRFRVAIVEDAQRLNEEAQNAFLKTLEEPPAGVYVILCADSEEPLLETVRSRCTRLRLGTVGLTKIADLLVERGLADPTRAATLARLAGGRPGVAIALAGRPDVEVTMGRVSRTLLDLATADRRHRLAAAGELVADGVVLARAAERGAESAEEAQGEAPASPEPMTGDGPVPETRRPGLAPAEKRRAVAAVLEAWRDLARDLALAGRGGRSAIRSIGLLEEIEAVAEGLPAGAVERFLERLDERAALVEANANPELALDTLLLAWPSPRRAV